ncbi:MAG: hypothetical protein WEF86_00720 [Gemmatimonadota bacterium]
MKVPRTTLTRGVLAGAAGATALAVWFMFIDLRHGEPFRTPLFLASALGFGDVQLSGFAVALYTLLHYGVFAVVGIAAAWIAQRLSTVPGLALGLALGFLLFSLVFYGSVGITGIDVVQGLGGWPGVLLGNLIAGVVLFTTLTALGGAEPMRWSQLVEEHYTIREGLITGLIGAVAVAIWFLIVDIASGRILFTPAALGSAVFLGARGLAEVQITAGIVLGYTALHVAAFTLTGLFAAGIVAAAEEESEVVLLGGVLLFVTLEAFSIGIFAIVAAWLVDALSWWNIGGANLIAAVCMAGYLYLRHPDLLRDVQERDLEEDLAQDVPAPGHHAGHHASRTDVREHAG